MVHILVVIVIISAFNFVQTLSVLSSYIASTRMDGPASREKTNPRNNLRTKKSPTRAVPRFSNPSKRSQRTGRNRQRKTRTADEHVSAGYDLSLFAPHSVRLNAVFLFSGDSSSSAELLKHEHKKLLPEAQQLQERALKITKATEQLQASGCFAGEQATEQAYAVLSATSDYVTDLQGRDSLLDRVIAFFRSAQTVSHILRNLKGFI